MIIGRTWCQIRILLPMILFLSALMNSQTRGPTYQGVTLLPGDVINFHGGIITTGHQFVYGHTALYLGIDPQTGSPTFLDFSVTKGGPVEIMFGTSAPFFGRILTEKEFLTYNSKNHQSFDIFQLQDLSNLNEHLLLQEAKRFAQTERYGLFTEDCSIAVATVLSKATGTLIQLKTPDGFLYDERFRRHPQLEGKTINLQVALQTVESPEQTRQELIQNMNAALEAMKRCTDAHMVCGRSCTNDPHPVACQQKCGNCDREDQAYWAASDRFHSFEREQMRQHQQPTTH